jgi:hypothetical protein
MPMLPVCTGCGAVVVVRSPCRDCGGMEFVLLPVLTGHVASRPLPPFVGYMTERHLAGPTDIDRRFLWSIRITWDEDEPEAVARA